MWNGLFHTPDPVTGGGLHSRRSNGFAFEQSGELLCQSNLLLRIFSGKVQKHPRFQFAAVCIIRAQISG